MKKFLPLICVAILLIGFANDNFAQGIQFTEAMTDSDMVAINKRAKLENKIIFIATYTTWCGPCKYMANEIFPNETVGRFYNEHFICLKMDIEKGLGILKGIKYEVNSIPTLLYINSEEEILHRATGTREVKEFIELGETALNPEKRFSHWVDKYTLGNRQPEFIREYLKQLKAAGMETKEISDWYFATQRGDEMLTKANFEMIETFVTSIKDSLFDFLVRDKEKFMAFAGKEKIEKKIYDVFSKAEVFRYRDTVYAITSDGKTLLNRASTFDDSLFEMVVSKIKGTDFEKKEELLLSFYIIYYYEKKDWPNYEKSTIKFVNTYVGNDYNALNGYAWNFYDNENIKNKEAMNVALGWVEKSIEINSNYYNHDTHAAVLFKLGRKKEALKAAEDAIVIGKKNGEDVSSTEELIKKFRE